MSRRRSDLVKALERLYNGTDEPTGDDLEAGTDTTPNNAEDTNAMPVFAQGRQPMPEPASRRGTFGAEMAKPENWTGARRRWNTTYRS